MAGGMGNCPLCGTVLEAGSEYCSSCGASIRISEREWGGGGTFARTASMEVRRDGPLSDDLRQLLQTSGRGGHGIEMRIEGGSRGPARIIVRESDGSERAYGSQDELPPNLRALFDRMQQMGMGRNLMSESRVLESDLGQGSVRHVVRMAGARPRFGMGQVLALFLGVVVPLMLIGYGVYVSSTGKTFMPHSRRFHNPSVTVGGAAAQAIALMAIGGGLWFHFGLFWRALPFGWAKKVGRYGERVGIVVVLLALIAFFLALLV